MINAPAFRQHYGRSEPRAPVGRRRLSPARFHAAPSVAIPIAWREGAWRECTPLPTPVPFKWGRSRTAHACTLGARARRAGGLAGGDASDPSATQGATAVR
eukprot:354905-Chlamydomonas_euryale.AAC.1